MRNFGMRHDKPLVWSSFKKQWVSYDDEILEDWERPGYKANKPSHGLRFAVLMFLASLWGLAWVRYLS